MKKPVILVVDTDASAVERDLQRQYGERFLTAHAESGESAIEIVRQFKLRGDVVAMFPVNQWLPGMTGVEFLAQAMKEFPRAKRVLLTPYADTDAAIKAINEVQIDYYLMKPWDPPDVRLYPVLDDLLEDWLAGYHPLVSPAMDPTCGGWCFNDETIRILRRIEFLRTALGINLAGIKPTLGLMNELERLRDEVRALHRQ